METGAAVGLAIGVSILTFCILGCFYKKRRACIPSAGDSSCSPMGPFEDFMAAGSFPPSVGVPAPIINCALYFSKLPDTKALMDLFKKQICKYRNFSSVPVVDCGKFVWRPVDVDVEKHFFESTANGDDDVHKAIECMMTKPLADDSRPWWEVRIITNTGTGQSVIVPRIHHSIGDGIALVQVFGDVIRDLDGNKIPDAVYQKKPRARKNFCAMLYDVLSSFFTVAGVAASPFDTDIPFNDPNKKRLKYSNRRTVVKVPNHDLSYVKAIKNAAGVTVNDVCFAATAGAIRKYCLAMGTAISDMDRAKIRALLPVAFPRKTPSNQDLAGSLRNKFTMVSSPIPVRLQSCKERLESCAGFFNAMKTSAVAPMALALNDFVNANLPRALCRKTAFDIFARHSVVFSNVPGPAQPVTIAGSELEGVQMVFPNLITQVGIVSYRGTMHMNFTIDDACVREAHKLGEFYIDELNDIAKCYGVSVPSSSAKDVAVAVC